MNKTILYVVVGLIVVVGAIMLIIGKSGNDEVTPITSSSASPSVSVSTSPSTSVSPLVSVGISVPKTVVISYTDSGFSPANVTIKKGDTIKYVNNSSKEMWPASAMHPSHNAYPETGGCIGSKFDACARIKTGATYSFTFNQVGSWGYHDHISPNFFGKITVTE